MSQTLGQLLAANQAAEKEQSTQLLRQRAEAAGAEAVRKLELVEAFFETAKTDFQAQILAGTTKVKLLLGMTGPANQPGSVNQHQEVESLLRSGNYSNELSQILDSPRHPYLPVWKAFQAWAASQGLMVAFEHQHDGGGIHGWHVLTAKPVPSGKR